MSPENESILVHHSTTQEPWSSTRVKMRCRAFDNLIEPKAMAVLMDPVRDSVHGPGGKFAPNDMRDEIFASIVQLTEMRLAGKSLADLPAFEVELLMLLLGRKEIEEILRIEDRDLAVDSPFTSGVTDHHEPFAR